jgi:hypothetical protein
VPGTSGTLRPGRSTRRVADQQAKLVDVEKHFAAVEGASVDHLDGLTVSLPDRSWVNLRASNTEPLLRLNVEAPTTGGMAALRDELLALSGLRQETCDCDCRLLEILRCPDEHHAVLDLRRRRADLTCTECGGLRDPRRHPGLLLDEAPLARMARQ